jgi:hypothetical protein
MAEQNETKLELMALWENTSAKGTKYWTGRLGNLRVVMFENGNRKSEKEPAMRVYVQEAQKKEDSANEDYTPPQEIDSIPF